jgi:DNA-directed RNA polymerase specialized sigma24 family protein
VWVNDGSDGSVMLTRKLPVRACRDRLPEPYRTALLLRDIEELDTEQVARQLGITGGGVKAGLHRARGARRALVASLVMEGLPVRPRRRGCRLSVSLAFP